jgi:methionine biosynthesis protein MetW
MATIEELIYDKIWDRTLVEKSDFSCTRIEEAINLLGKGNMLLDVGCGEGTFAKLAQKKIDHIYGIDLCFRALKRTNSMNFQVVKGNLNKEGISFQSDTFDAVTCLDVIEHVFDPVALLSEINRVLKENGILILTTPNVRFIDHISQILMKGKFPKTSDDPDTYNGGHVNYFTFRDIRGLLKHSGFNLLIEKGIAYRPYRTVKTFIFRQVIQFWEPELKKEFFCKGIAVKAKKVR